MGGWPLLASVLAWAGPRVLVEVDERGARWPGAPEAGDELLVLDAEGRTVERVRWADPRLRSVIHPDHDHHGGDAVLLPAGWARVELPATEGSTLRLGGQERPFPLPAPPTGAVRVRGESDPAQRLDLLFLGDGYTEAELEAFAADVERVTAYLLTIEPYASYGDLFNVWRVDTVSNESGSTAPGDPPRDTAFACAYGCGGLDRLICCDDEAVLRTVEASLPEADGVMVLINDRERYGGSGGFSYATSYVGDFDGHKVAAHEIGHTLVGLWDEYSYGIPGDPTLEAANCSPNAAEPPWAAWMNEPEIDAFETCSYTNFFRPTEFGCMMNSLQDGYCAVCRQEAIFAIYARLPGLATGFDPEPGSSLDARGDGPPVSITFDLLEPAGGLDVRWLLDGEEVSRDPNLDLRCSGLNGNLVLEVSDPTPWVRQDPYGLTRQQFGSWNVESGPPCDSVLSCEGCRTTQAAPSGALLAALLTLLGLRRRR